VRCNPGFLPRAVFSAENVFADFKGKVLHAEPLFIAVFSTEHAFRGFLRCSSRNRAMLEQHHIPILCGNDTPESSSSGGLPLHRSKLLCRNPSLEIIPGLKRTRTDAIFKKFNIKKKFKLKMNVFRKYFELHTFLMKHSAGLVPF
jgi:hypothetical protein